LFHFVLFREYKDSEKKLFFIPLSYPARTAPFVARHQNKKNTRKIRILYKQQ